MTSEHHYKCDPVEILEMAYLVTINDRLSEECLEFIFPGRHDSYIMEWRRRFIRGFSSTWSALSDDRKMEFVGFLIKHADKSKLRTNVVLVQEQWAEMKNENERLKMEIADLKAELKEEYP